ncbi:MAG: T9SS type A sorting domain-containing protein, partial [Bacteroidia bacterium]
AVNLNGKTGKYGLTAFVTICFNSIPLPIELLSFTGKRHDDKNILQWKTASENNNDYFTLEKSKDANTFQPIAKIKGAGNSTMVLNYSFTDNTPLSLGEGTGVRYYRLKQTDFNGTASYSKIISLNSNSKNENDFLIYPNRANDFINLFYVNQNVNDEIKIVNTLGETLIKTTNKNKIDVSSLPNGIYFVSIISENRNSINKFIKQ